MTTRSIILKSMILKPVTPLMSPALWIAICLTLLLIACGSGGKVTPPPPPSTYVLTVNSASPASGVSIAVTPSDNNNSGNGATSFTRTYNAGNSVTLTAPATAGGNPFSSWSGCTTASTVACTVILNANTTVIASYTAPAVTYYVSGSGSDSANGLCTATAFLTLQHAANLTQPGDTVYVMNGTYTNSCPSCDVLDIYNPGTPNNWITYQAYPGQTPQISFNGWEAIFFEPTAAYIQISGFTVVGNNYNVTLAQALAQSYTNPDPALNGNCIALDGRKGTATVRPNHIKILNNTVYACGGGGIGTAWSDYVTISGNTIYDSAWYSIYGASGISTWENWNSDSSTGYKMIITGNRIFGNANLVPTLGSAVATDGEGIIVDSTRNSAYQASIGLDPYTGRTYIANNVIYLNGSAAIEVFESNHVDVVNNSSYQDVYVSAVSGRGEMNANEATDVNVFNNIFYSASGQNPVTVCCNATQIDLDYNIYFGGSNYAGTVSGPHDLTTDPLYVDPADANRPIVNLSVSPNSPAVGSGTSNLAPSTDFAGNPRPGSKGYDRGAYQQP
jgi:hypothetical protein